jgi:hypothetical protein
MGGTMKGKQFKMLWLLGSLMVAASLLVGRGALAAQGDGDGDGDGCYSIYDWKEEDTWPFPDDWAHARESEVPPNWGGNDWRVVDEWEDRESNHYGHIEGVMADHLNSHHQCEVSLQ